MTINTPMIDMLEGDGAQWSELTASPQEIADLLATLTDEERFELGATQWHWRRAMEREAQDAKIKRVSLTSLIETLALAEYEGDEVAASRLRMTIAAVEMMDEAQEIVDLIASLDLC